MVERIVGVEPSGFAIGELPFGVSADACAEPLIDANGR
jgi:hypothetical protein